MKRRLDTPVKVKEVPLAMRATGRDQGPNPSVATKMFFCSPHFILGAASPACEPTIVMPGMPSMFAIFARTTFAMRHTNDAWAQRVIFMDSSMALTRLCVKLSIMSDMQFSKHLLAGN